PRPRHPGPLTAPPAGAGQGRAAVPTGAQWRRRGYPAALSPPDVAAGATVTVTRYPSRIGNGAWTRPLQCNQRAVPPRGSGRYPALTRSTPISCRVLVTIRCIRWTSAQVEGSPAAASRGGASGMKKPNSSAGSPFFAYEMPCRPSFTVPLNTVVVEVSGNGGLGTVSSTA